MQPDGKILVGGDFTTLSPNGGAPVTRNRIARLNPDGTLDTAFNPNASNSVYAIALQADGKVLVGGLFNGASSIGGQPRNRIARLDAATGAADSFNPNANSLVLSIAVQADGKILAGGTFTNIGGATRNRIARLDATTGLADSFDPNANFTVFVIKVQVDGKILAGGGFSNIGGQPRNSIARLNATTGAADSFDPNANSDVRSIAIQPDGKVLAGGDFGGPNSIGDQSRNFIARLDATTGAADSFDPNANSIVNAIAVQADGRILAGGAFNGAISIGGQTRNFIARLDPNTGLADSFDPNANQAVYAVAVQSDGKILVGGLFNGATGLGGQTRNHIARLETDGSSTRRSISAPSAALFSPPPFSRTARFSSAAALLPFWAWRGTTSRADDGTLDRLSPGRRRSRVSADSGLIGAPYPRPCMADRCHPKATFDPWHAVQADGKILLGGGFTLSADRRASIARLDAATGLADSFDPYANSVVDSIAVQADGKILVGGDFTNASAYRRAIDRPARCHHRVGRFVQPEREQYCLFNRGAGGRQDFGGRHFHTVSVDRPAIASPGSMPPLGWLIPSTRTRTVLSIPSRCRRTARF